MEKNLRRKIYDSVEIAWFFFVILGAFWSSSAMKYAYAKFFFKTFFLLRKRKFFLQIIHKLLNTFGLEYSSRNLRGNWRESDGLWSNWKACLDIEHSSGNVSIIKSKAFAFTELTCWCTTLVFVLNATYTFALLLIASRENLFSRSLQRYEYIVCFLLFLELTKLWGSFMRRKIQHKYGKSTNSKTLINLSA